MTSPHRDSPYWVHSAPDVTRVEPIGYCASGCVVRGQHLTDCPCATTHDADHDGHCQGCRPRTASYGLICSRCYDKLEHAIREAPSIVDWAREHAEPSLGQWNERVQSGEVDAPAPLGLSAIDDADELHANLASWALLLMETHPSGLHATTPHRQRRAADGSVVGVLPDSNATASIARFLTTHLESVTTQEWAPDMVAELPTIVRTLLARYPDAERAQPLQDVECPACHRTKMVYYPPAWAEGPITVKCEYVDCNEVIPEKLWDHYRLMIEDEKKAGTTTMTDNITKITAKDHHSGIRLSELRQLLEHAEKANLSDDATLTTRAGLKGAVQDLWIHEHIHDWIGDYDGDGTTYDKCRHCPAVKYGETTYPDWRTANTTRAG